MNLSFRISHVGLSCSAPLQQAQLAGAFTAEGLQLEMQSELGEATVVARLLDGHIDAVCLPAPVVIAEGLLARDLELEWYVHGLLTRGGYGIALVSEVAAALRDPPRFTSPPAPLRIGVPTSPTCARMLVHRWHHALGAGNRPNPLCIPVPLSQVIDFVAEGVIDGFCMSDPVPAVAQFAGIAEIVATSATLAPHHPHAVLVSPVDSRLTSPEVRDRFSRALAVGQAICAAPDRRTDVIKSSLGSFGAGYLSSTQQTELIQAVSQESFPFSSEFVRPENSMIISDHDRQFLENNTLFALGISGRRFEIRNQIAQIFRTPMSVEN